MKQLLHLLIQLTNIILIYFVKGKLHEKITDKIKVPPSPKLKEIMEKELQQYKSFDGEIYIQSTLNDTGLVLTDWIDELYEHQKIFEDELCELIIDTVIILEKKKLEVNTDNIANLFYDVTLDMGREQLHDELNNSNLEKEIVDYINMKLKNYHDFNIVKTHSLVDLFVKCEPNPKQILERVLAGLFYLCLIDDDNYNEYETAHDKLTHVYNEMEDEESEG